MAKKNQSDAANAPSPFENLGELLASQEPRTLAVVDHLNKEVRIVSGMDPKKVHSPFNYVAPEAKNKAGFINWSDSLQLGKVLQSFIAAFRENARTQGRQNEPDRYSFYEIPKSEAVNLATAIQRKFEGDKDADIDRYLSEFRVYPSELEKRKIERHQIPWMGLRKAGVNLAKSDREGIMHGLQPTKLFLVDIKTPDGLSISTPMGVQVSTNDKGDVQTSLVSPKAVPEFEEPQYKQIFTKEDKALLIRGMQPERLYPIPDQKTGETQWCAVSYCKELGRIIKAPAAAIKAPVFWDGVRLDSAQKDSYEHGGRILLEGCTDWEGRKYDCTLQFDAMTHMPQKLQSRYEKIYIYPSLEKQLDAKQLEALKNYKAIPAKNIRKSDGSPMTCSHIWIDPNTNTPAYGDLDKMKAQKYRFEKSKEASRAKNQPQDEEQKQERNFRRSRGRGF